MTGNKKKDLVTIKLIREADNMESVTRWANVLSFDIKYKEKVVLSGWSVQELPDEEENKEEK